MLSYFNRLPHFSEINIPGLTCLEFSVIKVENIGHTIIG